MDLGFFEADGGYIDDCTYDPQTGLIQRMQLGIAFTQKTKYLLSLIDGIKPGGHPHRIVTSDNITGKPKRFW